jgi:hypothetical protein
MMRGGGWWNDKGNGGLGALVITLNDFCIIVLLLDKKILI